MQLAAASLLAETQSSGHTARKQLKKRQVELTGMQEIY
jgi:hypothetical protein